MRPILKKQGDDFRKSDGQLRAGHRRWCRSEALKAFPERIADIGPNKGKDRNEDKREELTQRCFDLVKTAADKGDMDWWGIKSNLGLVEGDSKMKITKSQLTQIIKEELEAVLSEKKLTSKDRQDLKQSQFALPTKADDKKEKAESGNYPIPDESHARNALAMVARHGSASEKAKVRAAVKRKFPSIDVGGEKE